MALADDVTEKASMISFYTCGAQHIFSAEKAVGSTGQTVMFEIICLGAW